jgi:hypothetical protein
MKYLKSFQLFESVKNLPSVEEINKILFNNDKKELGQGGNAIVFEIPNYPNLVLRLKKSVVKNPHDFKVTEIIPVNFPVNFNCGQAVATSQHESKWGKGDEPIKILYKQLGTPAGGRRLSKESYLSIIKEIANLPQSAFDKLVEETDQLVKNGIIIDPSKPNNFLIDTKNKKINIVDVNYSSNANRVTIEYFISPLIDSATAGMLSEQDREIFKPLWGEIIKKIEKSVENYPNFKSQKGVDKYVNWLVNN